MNKRQDILKVFKRETPEYLPWFGDLAYWIDYLQEENIMPNQYLSKEDATKKVVNKGLAGSFGEEGLQKLHSDLGVGFYLQGYFPFHEVYNNMEYAFVEDSIACTRTTTFKTPYGELKEVWIFIKSTYSWAPKEYLIKNLDDLKALKYVYENMEFVPDYELAQRRKKTVGDNGIIVVYAPKSPMMELVALRAGIETVVDMYMDDIDLLEEVLEVMHKKINQALEIALNAPADCIFFPENLSSEVVGGAIFNNYIKPVYEEWTKKAKQADKISFVHLDGTLNPLITELSKVGFDVIEAITPSPVGDIAIEDIRSKVLDETIIWGGVPGGFFTDHLNDDEFDKFVINVINVMKNSKNFVLGVADQIIPGSSFKRVARVQQLIEKYGKISID